MVFPQFYIKKQYFLISSKIGIQIEANDSSLQFFRKNKLITMELRLRASIHSLETLYIVLRVMAIILLVQKTIKHRYFWRKLFKKLFVFFLKTISFLRQTFFKKSEKYLRFCSPITKLTSITPTSFRTKIYKTFSLRPQ